MLLREVNIEARKVQKFGREIFHACDVTSKAIGRRMRALQQT